MSLDQKQIDNIKVILRLPLEWLPKAETGSLAIFPCLHRLLEVSQLCARAAPNFRSPTFAYKRSFLHQPAISNNLITPSLWLTLPSPLSTSITSRLHHFHHQPPSSVTSITSPPSPAPYHGCLRHNSSDLIIITLRTLKSLPALLIFPPG